MSNQYSHPPPELPPGSYVWAYLRDSGGPTQGESIEQQEQEVKAYCNRYGLVLTRIFRDVARSGGSDVGRDEFMMMIDESQDETLRPQGLLIWDRARFARNNIDTDYYKATIRKREIYIHSITQPLPNDPRAARIVEVVIDLANEEKLRQTSRDVKRGLRALVSKGFWPGTPPKGYIGVKVTIGERRDHTPHIVSKLEPDPVLSEYVKLAWQLRAQGKSYQEITEATHRKLFDGTNSWNAFFRNKSYLGIGKCGELEVPDHHEPLITQEIFDVVQSRRDAHPRYAKKGNLNHPRRVGNPTILSGFTYCIECGAMMTHSTGRKSKPWLYYICGKKDRHGMKACNSRRVGAVNAEKKIMEVVLTQILTVEYVSDVIAELKKNMDSTADIERRLKAENRKLEDLDLAIRRTLKTIERTGSEAAEKNLIQREAERAQVKYEIENLKQQLSTAQMEITPEAINIILAAWREQITHLQESGNVRDIKAWLLQFVSRIELGYNTARIFYTYPMTDFLNARNTVMPRGGINFNEPANRGC